MTVNGRHLQGISFSFSRSLGESAIRSVTVRNIECLRCLYVLKEVSMSEIVRDLVNSPTKSASALQREQLKNSIPQTKVSNLRLA